MVSAADGIHQYDIKLALVPEKLSFIATLLQK